MMTITLRDVAPKGALLSVSSLSKHILLKRHRDSDAIEEANWRTVSREYPGLSAIRFAHWGVGWVEYLLTADAALAAEVGRRLEAYPVLDERDLAEVEVERWLDLDLETRVHLCTREGLSPFAARHKAPPPEVTPYL